MIEVYKSPNKPSPNNFFDSMFKSKRRQDPLQNDLLVPFVKTVTKGKDSAKHLGAVSWNSVPSHLKHQDSLEKFCDLIKKWKVDCKCKLCRDVGHIYYIEIVYIEKSPWQVFCSNSYYIWTSFKQNKNFDEL